MSQIHILLNQINKSSYKILEELDSKKPTFSLITDELQLREQLVSKLGDYVDSFDESSLKKEELESLKQQFDTFTELNKTIQTKAKYLLHFQQQKLATATKRRKAEDSYKVSLDSNVSYFQTSDL